MAEQQFSPCNRCHDDSTETALVVLYLYSPESGDISWEMKVHLCLPCARMLRASVEKELKTFHRPN